MLAPTHLSAPSFSMTSKTTTEVIKTLQALCEDDLQKLNQVILTHIEQRVPLIADIAKHLILAGGKRLRPLLALSCYRILSGAPSLKMVELAASIEFIHNATLLHDDVIDESPLRRGRPTANDLWGNKPSILVGDFLFAKAFELMLGENEKRVLPILANVSQTITEGEVFQLSYLKTFDLDESILMRIIGTKTAALFAASCEMSAALLDSPRATQESLHTFGYNLGIVFQIIDDLLDYIGNTNSLGKNVGDDLREGKVTLPLFLTYKKCTSDDQKMLERIIHAKDFSEKDMDMILALMHETGVVQECYDLAHNHAVKAAQSLQILPESPIKNILIDLCYSLVRRES